MGRTDGRTDGWIKVTIKSDSVYDDPGEKGAGSIEFLAIQPPLSLEFRQPKNRWVK